MCTPPREACVEPVWLPLSFVCLLSYLSVCIYVYSSDYEAEGVQSDWLEQPSHTVATTLTLVATNEGYG